MENIAAACPNRDNAVISIILDGENAWEYYPENAFYFLSALYRGLSTHAQFDMCTFSECMDNGIVPYQLSKLVAGSWVYGTFSTWIGDPEKNDAWDLLCNAKIVYDKVIASGKLDAQTINEVDHQLAICEGSDWFWWFGDYNPSESVKDFDHLFRQHLTLLYEMLGELPPDNLQKVISHGGGDPAAGGVMRHGKEA